MTTVSDRETPPSLADAPGYAVSVTTRRVALAVLALQALVLDHLLMNDGTAFWTDAEGHATTSGLARVAPSWRLLDRIQVARGFTPYQHFSLIADLHTAANETIREDPSTMPSLLVAPAIEAQYRDADGLSTTQAETLLARSMARLRQFAEAYDVPVIVTCRDPAGIGELVETAADNHLTCEHTRVGPRFVGEEFETLVYPVGDEHYQTTLAYWRRILGVRAEQAGIQPTPDTPAFATGVGTGVTVSGATTAATASPLLDAWTAGGGR